MSRTTPCCPKQMPGPATAPAPAPAAASPCAGHEHEHEHEHEHGHQHGTACGSSCAERHASELNQASSGGHDHDHDHSHAHGSEAAHHHPSACASSASACHAGDTSRPASSLQQAACAPCCAHDQGPHAPSSPHGPAASRLGSQDGQLLHIPGMDCPTEELQIRAALESLPGLGPALVQRLLAEGGRMRGVENEIDAAAQPCLNRLRLRLVRHGITPRVRARSSAAR